MLRTSRTVIVFCSSLYASNIHLFKLFATNSSYFTLAAQPLDLPASPSQHYADYSFQATSSAHQRLLQLP